MYIQQRISNLIKEVSVVKATNLEVFWNYSTVLPQIYNQHPIKNLVLSLIPLIKNCVLSIDIQKLNHQQHMSE